MLVTKKAPGTKFLNLKFDILNLQRCKPCSRVIDRYSRSDCAIINGVDIQTHLMHRKKQQERYGLL